MEEPFIDRLCRTRRQTAASYLEAYPTIAHTALDTERLPRMDWLRGLKDRFDQALGRSSTVLYTANLFGYIDSGGFKRDKAVGEEGHVSDAMKRRAQETARNMHTEHYADVVTEVSPRRYVAQLTQGESMRYGPLAVPTIGARHAVKNVEDIQEAFFAQQVAREVNELCKASYIYQADKHMREGRAWPEAREKAMAHIRGIASAALRELPELPNVQKVVDITLDDYFGIKRT